LPSMSSSTALAGIPSPVSLLSFPPFLSIGLRSHGSDYKPILKWYRPVAADHVTAWSATQSAPGQMSQTRLNLNFQIPVSVLIL
jgi:hypothetical protein